MTPSVSTRDSRRVTRATLKVVVLLSGVLIAVFMIFFFLSSGGIAELQQARRRVDGLRSDIGHLQTEKARLRGEIESAKKSSFAVERIAREDLGMSKQGEVVYMLPKK